MKIIDIVGARPQFIKLAPVLKEIMKRDDIKEVLIHTGQHYDYEMSDLFFDELDLKRPDYHLGVGSGTHGYQTAEMIKKIEDVLIKEEPDIVMVYGDTNSTLAGALASAKLHIKVAHVEAGLRSFNKRMPEEINRILTDHISDFLFCPTKQAVKNLKREGIEKGVYLTGDVMYDAIMIYIKIAEKNSYILDKLSRKPKSYIVATIHRAENTDNRKRLFNILKGLDIVSQKICPVILPLHPRSMKKIKEYGVETKYIKIVKPVSYLDMLILEKNAKVVITDSGGIQKEAFFFKVPCITLRDETEWVETVRSGWNKLVKAEIKDIFYSILYVKNGNKYIYLNNPDNLASKNILNLIANERNSKKDF